MNRKDPWVTYLDETHEAVCQYASVELGALARRAIHALRRMPATEIFGEALFRTIWDEYCYEAQYGPTPEVGEVLDDLVRSAISAPFDLLPKPVALLVSIGADYEVTNNCEDNFVALQPGLVCQAVKTRVDTVACGRKMDRFEEY